MSSGARKLLEGLRQEELDEVESVVLACRDAMVCSDGEEEAVPAEVRVKILGLIEAKCRATGLRQAEALWKARVQRTALMGLALVLLVLVGIMQWRFLQVEPVAMAKAYRLYVERQIIAAKEGVVAAKASMVWVANRLKEIDADTEATPQDRAVRKGNVIAIGNEVQTVMAICQQTQNRLSRAQTPDRIDAFTYFRDPFTGRTLAANATRDGRIDPTATAKYMLADSTMMRLLAVAKANSERGAAPLPPFLFDARPEVGAETLGGTPPPRKK